jgi:rhodanese-related sulfurtransferase
MAGGFAKKSTCFTGCQGTSEYETCHIANVQLMPMRTVPVRMNELDQDAEIVCICHHGGRSMQVAHFLEAQGLRTSGI